MRNESLIREFIAEAEEHLFLLEPNLLRLEKEPDNIDLINEMFLATHGIKGTASYVGLPHISSFTHTLETLFDRLRKRDIRTSPELIDILLEGVDMLKLLINSVSLGKPAPDTSTIEMKLAQWKEQGRNVAKLQGRRVAGSQRRKAPGKQEAVNQKQPSSESSILSTDLLKEIDLEDVEIFADIANQQIEFMRLSLDMIRESHSGKHETAREHINSSLKSLSKAFRNIRSSAAMLGVEALNRVLEKHAQYFSIVENPEYVLSESDTTNIEGTIQTLEALTKTITDYSGKESQPPEQVPQSALATSEPLIFDSSFGKHMLRVNAERVDHLLNLVGELVITRARLVQIGNTIKSLHDDLRTGEATLLSPSPIHRKKNIRLFKKLKDVFDEITLDLGRLTNQLQEGTMHIRMIPISQVVHRFPRMVRDLSRQAGKDVVIEIHGAETELDKSVMDVIGEPLIHIIRNAIDHGIEVPEDRQTQGKAPQGKIVLSASHQGNQVVIEVEDDGRGIDLELVKNKAIQQRLMSPQEADTLQDKEIAYLIFHTGFSTVETVSSLSGRGVGLHVVKRYLEKLNGTIELDTILGKGSKFTIRLPLTLAIIPALMVGVRTEVFALPLISVEEAVRIGRQDIKTIESHKVVHLREKMIPLVELGDLLGETIFETQLSDFPFESAPFDSAPFEDAQHTFQGGTQDGEKLLGVIISDGLREIGLIVDYLVGERDIVIKSLDDDLINVEGISGASIQGDGQVALVLDPVSLIELASRQIRHSKAPKVESV
jgi:two-component system chemotaxis sensor kinase CheA